MEEAPKSLVLALPTLTMNGGADNP
jgi:hypothetical protein